MRPATSELHLWRAQLGPDWPSPDRLPESERDRAETILPVTGRRRWTAARWALRGVLGRYLELDPTEVGLSVGEHGKPLLADPEAPLRFNLSHSGELALVAVASEHEVGVDVEWIGKRRPASFYADWSRHEAIVKCHGTGLGRPLPDRSVAVAQLDAGPGYAAAVAVAAAAVPPLRRFEIEPADLSGGGAT
jgi:phosphopantetheinyl transferase